MGKALPTIQQFRSHGHFLIHLFTNVHILKEMLIGVTFTTENFDHHTHTHTHTHIHTHTYIYIFHNKIRESNGTPLQDSCLENPMDGGAWQAAAHGVATSWTRLSDLISLFTFMHW